MCRRNGEDKKIQDMIGIQKHPAGSDVHFKVINI